MDRYVSMTVNGHFRGTTTTSNYTKHQLFPENITLSYNLKPGFQLMHVLN